jgi:hypothetical protein
MFDLDGPAFGLRFFLLATNENGEPVVEIDVHVLTPKASQKVAGG